VSHTVDVSESHPGCHGYRACSLWGTY